MKRRKQRDYKSTSVPQENSEKGRRSSPTDVVDGLSVEPRVMCRVEGSVTEDSLLVFQRCSIGWCRNPISNSSLAEEMRQEKFSEGALDRWFSRVVDWSVEGSALECRRVWISVFGVLVHVWSDDTFERLVPHWGSVIVLEEATAEPSSFERSRVLVETSNQIHCYEGPECAGCPIAGLARRKWRVGVLRICVHRSWREAI
ncbi:hypothetical protein V6N13_033678 [Hibiscus sabdariffa]